MAGTLEVIVKIWHRRTTTVFAANEPKDPLGSEPPLVHSPNREGSRLSRHWWTLVTIQFFTQPWATDGSQRKGLSLPLEKAIVVCTIRTRIWTETRSRVMTGWPENGFDIWVLFKNLAKECDSRFESSIMLLFILIFFAVVVNVVKYFHDNVGDEQSIIFIRIDQCSSDELEIWGSED